jgi:hypothetical protein
MARRNNPAWLAFFWVLLVACGPDTIFLRPALDTPAQHVSNGHNLLTRGKIDAANAEFVRAKNLDDSYAPAYVGLALVQGHRGNLDRGFETLEKARGIAATPDEAKAVDRGFDLLEGMRSTVKN